MSRTILPLWAAGPGELLQHGVDLLRKDSDSQRRIALILVDNAVELIAQTYISLPKRITGVELTRKQREDYCANFPSLLDGIEEHASEKILGLNLGEFEWFHRLRNQLYHEGNGLTVERRNVEVYAELALKLFEALFSCPLHIEAPDGDRTELIGEFFEDWMEIERKLASISGAGKKRSFTMSVLQLHRDGLISDREVQYFRDAQLIRNELVHGEAEPEEMLRPENFQKIKSAKAIAGRVFDQLLAEATKGIP